MPEIIGLEDLEVDYTATIKTALTANGFTTLRVNPALLDERKFPSKKNEGGIIKAHFFGVPAGCELKDFPEEMSECVIRTPIDLREVIALGKVLRGDKIDKFIYAPELTGEARKFLRIIHYPDWQGFGLTVSGYDPDDDNLWDMAFVGFSDT